MDEQVFCDGVGAISVIGGTVRIDLVTFSPTEKDEGGQPRVMFLRRVVMGPEAFLQTAEKIQSAATAITKAGIFARPPADQRAHVEPPPISPRPIPLGSVEPEVAPALAPQPAPQAQPAQRPFP